MTFQSKANKKVKIYILYLPNLAIDPNDGGLFRGSFYSGER